MEVPEQFSVGHMAKLERKIRDHFPSLSGVASLARVLSGQGYTRVSENRNRPNCVLHFNRPVGVEPREVWRLVARKASSSAGAPRRTSGKTKQRRKSAPSSRSLNSFTLGLGGRAPSSAASSSSSSSKASEPAAVRKSTRPKRMAAGSGIKSYHVSRLGEGDSSGGHAGSNHNGLTVNKN